MSGFHELDAYLSALLSKLEPGQRRVLARAVAVELRRRQSARIAAQRNPDGTPYEPRKPQLRHKRGEIRRSMFARLRMARFLKSQWDPNSAVETFAHKAQRIAAAHHFGLRDRVNKQGLTVQYPTRKLLGLEREDFDQVVDLVLQHVAP